MIARLFKRKLKNTLYLNLSFMRYRPCSIPSVRLKRRAIPSDRKPFFYMWPIPFIKSIFLGRLDITSTFIPSRLHILHKIDILTPAMIIVSAERMIIAPTPHSSLMQG